jgi:hypothetical protein
MICNSSSAVLLLTGHWPVLGASVVVFTRDGECHVVLPEDELELAQRTSGAVLIPYKPSTLAALTTPIDELVDPLRRLTARLGLSHAAIGLQCDEAMQPATDVNVYVSSLLLTYFCSTPRGQFAL